MGWCMKINCINSQRRRCNNINLLFSFFAFLISHTLLTQGRQISFDTLSAIDQGSTVRLRSMIGSRPPRCEAIIRCRSCGPCEAVQVPVVSLPVNKFRAPKTNPNSVAFYGGGGVTNYKPMCWKCKCGDSIFDP